VELNENRVAAVRSLRIERWTRTAGVAAVVIVVVLVALALGPLFLGAGMADALTRLFIYVILAVMWNALAGYGGLLSIGQQGFFGLGAYLTVRLAGAGIDPYLAIPLAAVGSGVISIVISAFMLQLAEGRFAIATWVAAELTMLLVLLDPAVHGFTGTSLAQIMAYAAPVRRSLTYWLALATMVVVLAIVFALLRSRVGAAVQAIRDDAGAAAAVGVRVTETKRILFVLAAFGAAAAGGLWLAATITFQPESFFSVQWSAIMIFMVLVGGIGTFEGALIGALVFFLIEHFLGASGVWYLITLGAAALVFALFVPHGIWGVIERRFGVNLLPVGYRVHLPERLQARVTHREGMVPGVRG